MYYIKLDNGTDKCFNAIPANTYALAGYGVKEDTGKLTVHYDNTLRPLIDRETGRQLRLMQMAGLTYNGQEWEMW